MSQEAAAPRVIRVFVSSTFRDMQQEREELVKRVFPEIRHVCEERGVAWSEIDLRWGVTDEQKAEGDVLPICLAEIDRSRPYFIGMLGQRYGWVPDELPMALADAMGWLRQEAGHSVTELEFLHGVLNDPANAGHAFFYLRDPAWVDTQPEADRSMYVDDPETTAKVGSLLEGLKDRVRHSGFPVHDYGDPVVLGDQVRADLLALVDAVYPDTEPPDPLDREAAHHAAFEHSRFAGFVPRPALAAALDAHAAGTEPPLMVAGEPGAGGSALVANWTDAWRRAHPDDVVIEHYVGATAASADWSSLVARLAGELGRRHGLAGVTMDTVAADPIGRRAALESALTRAAATGRRTVIVVDGVDELVDADAALDLIWLPAAPPAEVRIVLTSPVGRPVDAARERAWPLLEVPALTADERRALVTTYLARFAKALGPEHIDRLAAAAPTGNALYLTLVCDELRQWGDHFTLGDVVGRLLAATTVDDLLELVFARYESDYERDRPGLTRDAFSAIWAARQGLAEAELLDALGTAGERLPRRVWSPLFLAAEEGLVARSGYLTFSTQPHRQAVEDRYLADGAARAAAHAQLARVFAAAPFGPRVVDELPWQQLGAGDMDGLVATLTDLRFTDAAYRRSLPDLRRLWVQAEAAGHRMVDAYKPVVEAPADHADVAWAVARLLTDAGYPAEAATLHTYLVADARTKAEVDGDDKRLRAALVNLGSALWARGELAAAVDPLTEAIDRCRTAGDDIALAAALGDLALVRRDLGDLDAATPLFDEEEALCRARNDPLALQASLGNRAQLLRQHGDLDGALALMVQQEHLCHDNGDRPGTARALAAQAVVLADRGDDAGALPKFVAYGAVCRDLGDVRGLTESLVNQAVTNSALGLLDAADAALAEGEPLARRLADTGLLARVLVAKANRLAAGPGQWPQVEQAAKEAELSARSAGAMNVVATALGLYGTARREQGDLDGARTAHQQEHEAAVAVGDVVAAAVATANLAAVDIAGGQLDDALTKYAEAEPVFRGQHVVAMLLTLLTNRGQVLGAKGNVGAAVADYTDGAGVAKAAGLVAPQHQLLTMAVELLYSVARGASAEPLWVDLADACRAVGDDAGLQRALGERALLLIGRNDGDTAAPLLDEQEAVCTRIGDQVGLAACVGNRAILQQQKGDLAGSLASLDRQLAIAKASGNGQGALIATANRGDVLGQLGRAEEAIAALNDARQQAVAASATGFVAQLDQMIAALKAK